MLVGAADELKVVGLGVAASKSVVKNTAGLPESVLAAGGVPADGKQLIAVVAAEAVVAVEELALFAEDQVVGVAEAVCSPRPYLEANEAAD